LKKLIFVMSGLLVISLTSVYGKENNKVIAEVNGIKITQQELNQALKKLPPQVRKLPNAKKMMLDNLVKEDLLYSEALKENLENDPEVKKAIEQAKKRILILYLLKKHVKVPKVKITDEEVKAFYDKNKKVFSMNGKPINFNSLKPKLKEILLQNKQKEAYMRNLYNYIDKLRASSNVKIMLNSSK